MRRPRNISFALLLAFAALEAIVLILWPLSHSFPRGASYGLPPRVFGLVSSAGEMGFIIVNNTRPAYNRSNHWQVRGVGMNIVSEDVIRDASTGKSRIAVKLRWRTVAALVALVGAFLALRVWHSPPTARRAFEVEPSPAKSEHRY